MLFVIAYIFNTTSELRKSMPYDPTQSSLGLGRFNCSSIHERIRCVCSSKQTPNECLFQRKETKREKSEHSFHKEKGT